MVSASDSQTFQLALVQMRCSTDPAENLARAIEKIADAGRRGADVVCLPELFRTQYFCQSEDHANFALAESIPGPGTEALCAAARAAQVTLVASLFERRAAGLYHNTAITIAPDGRIVGHVSEDAHSGRPAVLREVLFHPGRSGLLGGRTPPSRASAPWCAGISGTPKAARLTALAGADLLLYPTAIGWHPSEKAEFGAAQADRLADDPARRTPSPTASTSAPSTASATRGRRTAASSSGAARSWPIRSASCWPRPSRTEEETLIVDLRSPPSGDRAPALAVLARPPHRRLRRHQQAFQRSMSARVTARRKATGDGRRWRGIRHAGVAGIPDARRVGAARGDLAGVAPRAGATGRASSRPFPGSTARWCASFRPVKRCAFSCRARRWRREARALLKRVGVPAKGVRFFRVPTDRSWTRDTAPIFVRRDDDGAVAVTDWKFNGWAKYPNHHRDDAVPAALAKTLKLPRFVPVAAVAAKKGRSVRRQVVLEGGSIDVDGDGTLLTTEECLLSPVQARNPGSGARRAGADPRRAPGRAEGVVAGPRHRRRRHPRTRR